MAEIDRLQELQRQRAMVLQQLEWLERQIAEESRRSGAPAEVRPPPPAPQSQPAAAAEDPDALLERLTSGERKGVEEARRGCIVAFVAFMLLLCATVLAIYFLFFR